VLAGVRVENNRLIGDRVPKKLPPSPKYELGIKQIPRPEVTTKMRISVAMIAPIVPLDRIDHNNPSVKQNAM
jgi:hypothetical protein